MINFVGRLFVVLMFAASIGALALAISVYANHVDLIKGTPAQPSVLERHQAKIKELAYARDRSMERYNAAYSELGQSENLRVARQRFYDEKYALLRTGKNFQGQALPTPVYDLEIDPATNMVVPRLVPANANLLIQVRGEPLKPLDEYQIVIAARNKDILDELAKIKQAQESLARLAAEMQGTANVPGLIRKKEIMADARVRAMAQQEFLKPALANRFAEATMALEREQDLRRRLGQLGGAGGRNAGD